MRKRILSSPAPGETTVNHDWLDLDRLAQVEISSEDPDYPIESALSTAAGPGWRAADAGEQTIRILFDEPARLRHLRLLFEEPKRSRTQEFVLRWSADGGKTFREVVRQQFNFSPPDATREEESYSVELEGVTTLELRIVPDIAGGMEKASLGLLRLA